MEPVLAGDAERSELAPSPPPQWNVAATPHDLRLTPTVAWMGTLEQKSPARAGLSLGDTYVQFGNFSRFA